MEEEKLWAGKVPFGKDSYNPAVHAFDVNKTCISRLVHWTSFSLFIFVERSLFRIDRLCFSSRLFLLRDFHFEHRKSEEYLLSEK